MVKAKLFEVKTHHGILSTTTLLGDGFKKKVVNLSDIEHSYQEYDLN